MPLLRPPFYAQEKDSSCLAACLRMVLAAYGVVHSERHLRDLCEWTPQRSISSTAAVAAARALGFIHTRERITPCASTICAMRCVPDCTQ